MFRVILIAALSLFTFFVISPAAGQENGVQQSVNAYSDSENGLKRLFEDIMGAAKSHDKKKETQLVHGLMLPGDSSWFKDVFGRVLGERALMDYKREASSLESNLRRVLDGNAKAGMTDFKVKRITDPDSVEHTARNVLNDMEPRQALYQVDFMGKESPTMILTLQPHGPSFQSSGDPNGYFFYIDGSFRFLPVSAFLNLPANRSNPGFNPPPVPIATYAPGPALPEQARKEGVSGTVRLKLVVDAKGRVKSATVKDGDPRLIEAAETCVRRWRFKPPLVDGKPVESQIEAEISFPNPN